MMKLSKNLNESIEGMVIIKYLSNMGNVNFQHQCLHILYNLNYVNGYKGYKK